jgi:hypothetical protein
LLALVTLQRADEVPTNRPREDSGFGVELLGVVFAEVEMGGRGLVEGEDVGGGFEFGDGDEADLRGVTCKFN